MSMLKVIAATLMLGTALAVQSAPITTNAPPTGVGTPQTHRI